MSQSYRTNLTLYAPSPGWKQGKKRSKRKTYSITKKSHSRSKKSNTEAA